MGKRGADVQITKDDEGTPKDDAGGSFGNFPKATAEKLATRRIAVASAKKRRKPSSPAGAPTANPFAKVELKGNTEKGGVSFAFGSTPTGGGDKPKPAGTPFVFGGGGGATPAPARTPFPGFGGGTPATGASAPFGFGAVSTGEPTPSLSLFGGTPGQIPGFSFTSGATPAPSGGGLSFGAKPSVGGGGSSSARAKRFQKHANALEADFHKKCAPLRLQTTNIFLLLDDYLDAAYSLENTYWKGADDTPAKKNSAAAVSFAVSPAAALVGVAPLFRAPTPAAKSSPKSPPFTSDTAATVEAPSDAPAATSEEPSIVACGDSDKEYTTLVTLEGTVGFYVRNKATGASALQCKGHPKIQENNNNNLKRLVMWNEASGKLLVNMAIPAVQPLFSVQKTKKHLNGIETAVFIGMLTAEQKEPIPIYMKRACLPGKPNLEEIMMKHLGF